MICLLYCKCKKKQEVNIIGKRDKFVNWVKTHKTELIITDVTVVGTVLVIKNWDSIKRLFKAIELCVPEIVKIEPVREEIIGAIRNLGDKVWCSAQAINKRIIATGLSTKIPCGEYMMTEVGRMFGKETWKTTAVGQSFFDIEWDEKSSEVIFCSEELLDIVTKQERARQMVKTLYGKLLIGNLAFGTEYLRQEWMTFLSYERLNSTCSRLNATTVQRSEN